MVKEGANAESVVDEPQSDPFEDYQAIVEDAYKSAVGLADTEEPEVKPEAKPEQTSTKSQEELGKVIQNNTDTLEGVKSQLEEANAQNTAMRVALTQMQQRLTAPPQPPAEPAIDTTAIAARMRTDPIGAIVEIVNQITDAKISKTATNLKAETQQETAARLAYERAYQQDRQKTLAEFGDMLTNEEFKALAEQHFATLNPDGHTRPGTMYAAAASAYAELVRTGKIQPKAKATVTDIRGRIKAPAPVFGMEKGKKGDEGQLDLTSRELSAISRIARDFGLKQDDLIKGYIAERKLNPNYGK